jgi:cytochrome c-type biogenesis protein
MPCPYGRHCQRLIVGRMYDMEPESVTLPLAVLAGLLSFISPCVLPLIPAYISYLTGQAAAVAGTGDSSEGGSPPANPSRWMIFLHGVFFVLGFSTIFIVLFGFGAGLLGQISRGISGLSRWIGYVGGILIVVLGLHVMGVIRIPFLYYDTRRQSAPRPELGYLGSALMGITFAAGWSPCVGPILGAMIGLSYNAASIGRSLVLFTAYAAGLGIPFLLTALLIERAGPALRRLQRHMRWVEIISGVLLIVIGILVFFGSLQRLSALASGWTDFAIRIDEWLASLAASGQ